MHHPPAEATAATSHATAAAVIYGAAFVTGAIVMSFEMLGSRYLNPYFGSGIYTWAALISTVLIALTAGYFLGGSLADRTASPAVLALTVIIGSAYLLVLPSFAQAILEFVLASIDDIRAGSLIAALALMFFPGDPARHVFAVRHQAAAALAAELRPRVGRGLRRLHRRLDRRHARHDLLPDPVDRLTRDHAHARGGRAGRGVGGAGAVAAGAARVRRARGGRARSGDRAEHRSVPGRKPDRRRRPGGDAQAPQRPHCPHRDRIQRRLHHQAAKSAGDVVPGQGLGLHGIGGQPDATPTTCRCATRR